MTDIAQIFDHAQLALAAYADLTRGSLVGQVGALTNAGFAGPQVQTFGADYSVVTQYTEVNSGFTATVFQASSGNLTLAIRGTSEGPDYGTDGDIFLAGAGYDQIVSMYNWWQRASNIKNQLVPQYRIKSYLFGIDPAPPAGSLLLSSTFSILGQKIDTYLESTGTTSASGDLVPYLLGNSSHAVDVVGHSLGGHLAMAFGTLFPTVTGQVTVFDAPGFTTTPINQQFFTSLGGYIPNGANTLNVAANEANIGGAPWLAIAGLHSRPGFQVNIPIENQLSVGEPDRPAALNHSQMLLTDALAVFSLLASLDQNLSTSTFQRILAVADNRAYQSLERIVDVMERLLRNDNTLLPTGNGSAERDALYNAIYALRNDGGFQALQNHVEFDSALPSGLDAKTDFGAFLSLAYLTPFTLKATGSDELLQSLHPDLYAKWQMDQNLPAQDDAGARNFSDQWLTDRSKMISWIAKRNAKDIPTGESLDTGSVPDLWQFSDRATDTTIRVSPGLFNLTQHYVTFGNNGGDAFNGGSDRDNLYGGNGSDNIDAGAGDDYLEGNAGSDTLKGGLGSDYLLGGDGDDDISGGGGTDTLKGGAGSDTYRFTSGDGNDIIIDSDGQGSIVIDGQPISGGKALIKDGQIWQSTDEKVKFTLLDLGGGKKDLYISYGDKSHPDSILIKNYTSGSFGISLREADPAQASSDPQFGDLSPVTGTPGSVMVNGVEVHYTAYHADDGNHVVTAGSGNNDINIDQGGNNITCGPDNNFALVLGGNNMVAGGRDDYIVVKGGRNVVTGRGGKDILLADGGNNRLYAGSEVDLATAIRQAKDATATAGYGDFFDSGSGDNTLIGGTADDLFLLGSGNNVVVMGPGNASLTGGVGAYQYPSPNFWDTNSWSRNGGENIGFSLRSTGFVAPTSYNGNYVTDAETGQRVPVGLGNDTIYGGSGNNVMALSNGDNYVDAGGGNDLIGAGAGRSTIFGGSGNDTIYGGGGTNYIEGEGGNDLIVARGGHNTIFGGSGDDTIVAGETGDSWASSCEDGANYINAGSGNSVIYGSGGHDTIIGGAGNDTIYAGDGDQYIFAESGSNQIYGGSGNDTLVAGTGNDTIYAGSGDTTIYGGEGSDLIVGGEGTTVIYAGSGGTAANPTRIAGGSGNTIIYGGSGIYEIAGGTGNTVVYAGDGGTEDTPTIVQAGSGETTIYSGAGYDQLISGGNTTFALSGGGQATLFGTTSSDALQFDSGVGPTGLTVTAQLYSDGASSMIVNDGVGGSATVMNGFVGVNQFKFSDSTLNLSQFMRQSNVIAQNLGGGSGAGLILNVTDGEQLTGGSGNDTILGFGANDMLDGGAGDSVLVGGGGNSTYVVSALGNQTTINGSVSTDTLQFTEGVHVWDLATTSATAADGAVTETIQMSTGGTVTVHGDTSGMLSRVVLADSGITTMADLVAQSTGGKAITAYADGTSSQSSNDGHGNVFATRFDVNGVKVGDLWKKDDGSHGTDTFNPDGSSSGTSINLDGSHSDYTNDGHGNAETTSYNSQGSKVGDSWTKADGTHGTDIFTGNGASSGVTYSADGSYTNYSDDGHGNVQTTSYDPSGVVIGETSTSGDNVTHTDDGQGNSVTYYYDAHGNKVSDRWQKSDGSYGSDYFNADGSSTGVAYRADGSYSTYANDGQGQVQTRHLAWDGSLLGTSVTEINGNNNVITSNLNATGTKLSENWIHSDGRTGNDFVGPVDYTNGLDFYGAVSMATMYGGTSSANLYGRYVGSDWTTPNSDSAVTPYWAEAYSSLKFDSGSLYITTDTTIYRTGYADSEIYYHAEGNPQAWLQSDSVAFDFNDHIRRTEFSVGENWNGTVNIDGYSTVDFDGWRRITTTNARTPIVTTLHGTNGTYSTLRMDGQGNASVVSYSAQGNKVEDMWLHNDGSRGFDLFYADGSSSGMAAYANGSVATYTDDGYGHVATALTVRVPTQITLPTTLIVSPPSAPELLTTSPQGLSFLSAYVFPSDDIIVDAEGKAVKSVNGPMEIVWSMSIMTDPGYGASFIANGRTTYWEYSDAGALLSSYTDDGQGNVVTYSYNGRGHVTQYSNAATDANGNVHARIYNLSGNLVGSSTVVSTSPGQKTTTMFDAQGDVTGSSIFASDGNGNSIESKYDAGGHLLALKTVVVTSTNSSTITFYDGQRRPTGVIQTSVDSNGVIHTHNYDANGHYIGSVIATPDSSGNYATANYDASGHLTSYVLATADAQNRITFETFDGTGKLLNASTLERSGIETYTTYSSDGSSVRTTRNVDHSYSIATDDGFGNRAMTRYSATEVKLDDTWSRADGSSGTDSFNIDGSASGSAAYTDGSRSSYVKDAQGTTTTSHFGTDGHTLTGSSVTATVQGRVLTTNYDVSGGRLNDHWTATDGTSGRDVFNADGAGSGTTINVDGSYSTYTDDGHGNITTTYFDKNGVEYDPNARHAPEVTNPIGDQTTAEAVPFHFTIPEGTFTDMDASDTLSYSVSLANDAALPAWLTFDAQTRTLSGIPADADTGVLNLKVTAVDSTGLSTSSAFSLTINNVNEAPIVSNVVGAQTVDEASQFHFVIPENIFTDPDAGDTRTYSVFKADGTPLPSWLTFDAQTRTLMGTPMDADTGVLSLKIVATDQGGLSASTSFDVTVNNVNQAPTVAMPLANVATDEAKPFTFVIPVNTFTDPDAADALSYNVSLANGNPLPSWITFDPYTRTLSGTPADADTGILDVKVTAVDQGGLVASTVLNLTINDVNEAPVVQSAIDDQSTDELKPFSFVIPSHAFADPDAADTLSYSLSLEDGSPLPAWLAFDAATRTLSGTPSDDDIGALRVKVAASDPFGLTASTTFTLTVNVVDTIWTDVSYVLPAHVHNLVGTGSADLTLTGNSLDNIITANDGNDTLIAGSGLATLVGGMGNDTFVINNVNDAIIEQPNAGNNTVLTSVSYVTPANLQNIIGTGTADITLTGNDLNNVITANSGNDTLVAGTGVATMNGGTGNNTFVVNNSADVVHAMAGGINTILTSVSFVAPANVKNLTGTGTADITLTGNGLDNVITANNGNDVLVGGNGNTRFVSGAGNDTISGGSGNDTYYYHRGSGLDSVTDQGGDNRIQFGEGLSLENVTIRLTMPDGDPYTVNANASNFVNLVLNGQVHDGTRTLNAHLRILDEHGVEQSGQGMDFAVSLDSRGNIISPIQNFQFADGTTHSFDDVLIKREIVNAMSVSGPVVTGRNDNVVFAGVHTGEINLGSGNDIAYASARGNTIYGGSGDDYIVGFKGDDTLVAGWGTSVISGGGGTDTLTNLNGTGALLGGAGTNTITTGAGNDFIGLGVGMNTVTTGATYNVVAFNAGQGNVVLNATPDAHNTLSLGGGLSIRNLSLTKTGNDLTLKSTAGDQLTFKDWYSSPTNHDFVTLQVIEQASADYNPWSTDPLRNKRFEEYDFGKLVAAFDQARNANSFLSRWSLTNGMLDAHLGGSDTALLGGELAYEFGVGNDIGQTQLAGAIATLKDPQFGRTAQTVHRFL